MPQDLFDINKLINSAFFKTDEEGKFFLRTEYEKRLLELGVTSNQVEQNLQIEYRTLNGILDGNLQRFDLLSLLKIGHFLGIEEKVIVEFYTKLVSARHEEELNLAKKRTFILNHFDLPVLRTIGVIDSIRDFDQIEAQISAVFSLESILDYEADELGAAYSSTNVKPKNEKSRTYFTNKARKIFELIDNPNEYNKEGLIRYFPKVRWHSTDLENGLVNVVKSLFELGVTVIFHPRMPSLQIRGATFSVANKPCIVLTDYRESYPTLWYAFIHELFHVFFDWEEIVNKTYHLSDEEHDLFVLKHKETEASEFARDYLFPPAKLDLIRKRIDQKTLVREFALDNHVHPSIVYSSFAFVYTDERTNYWAVFDKLIRPPMAVLKKNLSDSLTHSSSVVTFAEYYRQNIFNTQRENDE